MSTVKVVIVWSLSLVPVAAALASPRSTVAAVYLLVYKDLPWHQLNPLTGNNTSDEGGPNRTAASCRSRAENSAPLAFTRPSHKEHEWAAR